MKRIERLEFSEHENQMRQIFQIGRPSVRRVCKEKKVEKDTAQTVG